MKTRCIYSQVDPEDSTDESLLDKTKSETVGCEMFISDGYMRCLCERFMFTSCCKFTLWSFPTSSVGWGPDPGLVEEEILTRGPQFISGCQWTVRCKTLRFPCTFVCFPDEGGPVTGS